MATLFIHIGMPKAGSTSIQRALFTSRPALAKYGVGHLSLAASHDRILLSLFRPDGIKSSLHRKTNIQLGLDAKETEVDLDVLKARMDEEIAANTFDKFVITGERLHRFDASTRLIRDYFRNYFDDIRIIVYVREPVSWATSRTQHSVATGKAPLEDIYDLDSRPGSKILPHYRRDLEPYIGLYGRDAVDIRVFDRKHFVGGTLMNDFSAALGVPELGGELPDEVRNAAVCYEGVLLSSEYQRAMARRGDKVSKRSFKRLQHRLKDLEGTPFRLPEPVAAGVQARVAADVAWLRETTNSEVFATAAASGGEPAWPDGILKQMTKMFRRRENKSESDTSEAEILSETFDALGLELVPGRRGRMQLGRKQTGPQETAPAEPAEGTTEAATSERTAEGAAA